MAPAPPPSPAPDFYPKDSICISCQGGGGGGGGEAGGSGAGQAACSLDPFSIATAGSSGGTKSPGASSARSRTELAAGSGRRAVTSPAQSSIPTSSAFFPPSLPPPSLPPLPPPPSATIRTQSELGLAPAPTSPTVCSAAGRAGPCRAVPCRGGGGGGAERRRRRTNLRGCGRVRGRARSPHARRAPRRPQPGPRLGASRRHFAAEAPSALGIKILTALGSRGRGGAGKCRLHPCLSLPSSPLPLPCR